MKQFVAVTLFNVFIFCTSGSFLQAAAFAATACSQRTFREQIINPPSLPFDKNLFFRGFGIGLISPIIGICAAMIQPPFKLFSKYKTFKNNPTETARNLGAHIFRHNDPVPEDFVAAYVELRKAMVLDDQTGVHRCIDRCNAIIKQDRPELKDYDIITIDHNNKVKLYIEGMNTSLGLLIGSTLSTFGWICLLIAELSAKETMKPDQRCTCVCVEDLD